MKVSVLVVPVYRRHWLFHAWSDPLSAVAEQPALTHGAAANSALAPLQQLGQTISSKVTSSVHNQWQSLQQAKEGSFKSWLYKLAQTVLSREDPVESFLKAVPKSSSNARMQLEIVYPASMPAALVRRRLRLIAAGRARYHQRRLVGWGLLMAPQLPLMLTPFPNVTLYFTVYRFMSHYQALHGALSLGSLFQRLDEEQLQQALEAQKKSLIDAGVEPKEQQLVPHRRFPPTWRWRGKGAAATEAQEDTRSVDSSASPPSLSINLVDHAQDADKQSADSSSIGSSEVNTRVIPIFTPSKALDDIVHPLDRWQTPLSEEAGATLSTQYHLSNIDEVLSRIRKRALQGPAQSGSKQRIKPNKHRHREHEQ